MNVDKDKFLEIFAVLCVKYGKVVDPAIQNLFWNSLRKYPIDKIEHAMQRHLEDSDQGRFFPSIAHVMKYLKSDDKSEALNAFAWVMKLSRIKGRDENPKFKNVLLEHVVQLMRWDTFCNAKDSDIQYLENRFIGYYFAGKDKSLLPDDLLRIEKPNENQLPKNITDVLSDKDAANDDPEDDNDNDDDESDAVVPAKK